MTKSLQDYLLGVKKTHNYTVRVANHVLTDENIDRIESNLKAYELVDITRPKKSIIQTHPLGFAEPINAEVYLIDVKLGLPASSFYLGREIAKILKISEIYVVVNGDDNPVVDYADALKKQEEAKPGEPMDVNVDPATVYGGKYNENMLKTILDARKKDVNSISTLAMNQNNTKLK